MARARDLSGSLTSQAFFSLPGNPDFYQDRDPLRVSISREQSFTWTPLDRDPFAHPHPIAQENIRVDDCNEAGERKEWKMELLCTRVCGQKIFSVVLFVMKNGK